MTNGTSGDERHRRVRAGLTFSCKGSSDALWAITQFQNQEKIYSFLSCSLGSLARDKLQDATAIQRRRFVAAPRHVGKDYWQVERHRKNHCCASPFSKNHGIKKRPPGYIWMNATVHDLVSPREQ